MDLTTPSPMDVNCTYSGEESVICNGTLYSLPEMPLTYTDTWFWVFIGIYVGLVLFAGEVYLIFMRITIVITIYLKLNTLPNARIYMYTMPLYIYFPMECT